MPKSSDPEIAALDRIEIAFEPWGWPFARERREEIDRHFAQIQRQRAAVWNGRALLLNRWDLSGGVFRGRCFETDYASLCAWCDWDFPDTGVGNFFAAAALRGDDGGYLIGKMAADTANAGRLYFPCGTPEPSDVDRGAVDMAENLARELLEETGIAIDELKADSGWTMVRDRSYIAFLKRLTAPQSAEALRERIMAFLAREARPEFADIRIVRSPDDFDPAMSGFVTAFLTHVWS